MRRETALLVLPTVLLGCARPAAPPPRRAPPPGAELVTFRGLDGAELHGFIYLPAGSGPFPAVLWNHGSERLPGWQPDLGAFYTANGFAFFIPHRRGQGRSSAAGPYIMDRQPSELRIGAGSTDAGKTVIALHEEASRDVDAALAWLMARPDIDPSRIVMSGVSFGGIQTLLAAEKDLGVRAFVAFAPAAMSWRWVAGLDARLEEAVGRARAPVLVVQARNDYDLAPSLVLGPLLVRAGKGRAEVFPAFGKTEQEGHGGFACTPAGTAIWGPTVLAFFRDAMTSSGGTSATRPSLRGLIPIAGTPSDRGWNVAMFFNGLKRQVVSRWRPEEAYAQHDPAGTSSGARTRRTTELRVELTAEGGLRAVEVAKSSGLGFLDDAAVAAFRETAPFEPPPERLLDKDKVLRFRFGFVVGAKGEGPQLYWHRDEAP